MSILEALDKAREYFENVSGFSCHLRNGDSKTLVVESDTTYFFISEAEASFVLDTQNLSFGVDSLERVISQLEMSGIEKCTTGTVDCFK